MRVNNIESGNYQGYVWKSNEKDPTIVSGIFNEELSAKNAFIIEGFLYDDERGVSYSIKYVDGEYIINKYDVPATDFNRKDVKLMSFYAHRMNGHKKMDFLQYWRVEKDDKCCDMDVLQPAELVFVGFNDK